MTTSGHYDAQSLRDEIASADMVSSWIEQAPAPFVREMLRGLLATAIESYDSKDFALLGRSVAEWAATLELEADRKLARRLRRRLSTLHPTPARPPSG